MFRNQPLRDQHVDIVVTPDRHQDRRASDDDCDSEEDRPPPGARFITDGRLRRWTNVLIGACCGKSFVVRPEVEQTRPVNVDPGWTVRDGYDRIAESYLTARPSDGADMALLGDLTHRLRTDAAVLDAGCGAGFPLSADLARRGFRVVGLDFSPRQLGLAQARLGALELVQADLAHLPFGHASFDAVVSYYAIIHIPRSFHVGVFSEFHRVLRPGGMALLCLGWTDNPADHDPESWLGVPMFWSHYNADTNLRLLQQAGFGIEWSREVPDPMEHASHQFVLARRT